ncbi:MAG: GGDEF domain-containing protein [Ectothiorhodospiraceae bacterium]|nr:GGDEF domain-containing protein [Ectothiorhodospiraceae bacterium]
MNTVRENAAMSPVKAGFFIYFMVFFGLVSGFTIVANLLIGLEFYLNYKWMGISGVAFALAYWARRGRNLALIHRIGIYLSAFVVFPVSWMASAGLASPAITYAVLIVVMVNYLLTGRERLAVNVIYIAQVLVLISLYFFRPALFASLTPAEQYADWMVNVPIVLGFLALVLARFERAFEQERLANARKAEELRALTVTDALTGLANRLALHRELTHAMAAYRRTGTPFSLIFLDVDAFKAYNDAYGHTRGDACLRRVADCIRSGLRREGMDRAFRFGGEEFVVLLEATDAAGACRVATHIREALQAAAIPHSASPVGDTVTASMGVAQVSPRLATPDAMLAAADAALYQAKQTGRDSIVCAPVTDASHAGNGYPVPAAGG